MNEDEDVALLEELGSVSIMTNYPKKNPALNIFGNKVEKLNYKESDLFFEDVYKYFYRGGLKNIIFVNCCEILFLMMIISILIFFSIFLDLDALLTCTRDSNFCGDISVFINVDYPYLIPLIFLICSIMMFIYRVFWFFFEIKHSIFVNNFYKEKLGIIDNDLPNMMWVDVLTKLEKKFHNSMYNITNKIMRKDNFYIALIQKDIIYLNTKFYTKQLEMNLRYAILNDIDNINVVGLNKMLKVLACLNLIFSPIIFSYLLFYFVISNIEDVYTNYSNVNIRRFNLFIKWKFRQFNEVKHFYKKRMKRCIPFADKYLKQFPNQTVEIVAKYIAMICGFFFSLSMFLSLLDEHILLSITVMNRSLLFYAGIFGAISSLSRSFLKVDNYQLNPKHAMKNLFRYTKFVPHNWHNKFHTFDVRNEFSNIYQNKFILLFYELLGVFTSPYYLFFYFPNVSESIVSFIKINSFDVYKIGKICTLAYSNNIECERTNSVLLFNENHKIIETDDEDND
jgi:autophagy-related protein 9